MTTETTTTPDAPAAPEVAPLNSTESAAQALLARWQSKQADKPATAQATESEAPDTAEAEAETDAEQPDEGTADATDDAESVPEDEIELDVAGEKVKLPAALKDKAEVIQRKAKELEAGATKKFQEAAEVRKAAEVARERADRIAQFGQKHVDLIAAHNLASQQLQASLQTDLRSLSAQDPVAAQQKLIERTELQQYVARLEGQIAQAGAEFDRAIREDKATKVDRVRSHAKSLKGWSEEADARLAAHAQKLGMAQAELDAVVTSPALYEALYKSMLFDSAAAANPSEKRAAPAQKTLRPGTAAAPNASAKAAAEAAQKRLKATGKTEDLVSLLLARQRLKGR